MTGNLPTSKATNAYEVLDEVAALALAEPQRIHMNFWRLGVHGKDDRDVIPPRGFPPCGTVGCIGGWTELLIDPHDDAWDILGLEEAQAEELFYPNDLMDHAGDQLGGMGQTPEHAADVVTHIRKFQKKYRTQLLAKKV